MNIFFDVDYTLIDADEFIRPRVKEVFERLKSDGHSIYVWSGRGVRWDIVDQYGLRPYVSNCYEKPLVDYRNRLKVLGVDVWPDYCIDDHNEIVQFFGGFTISPYYVATSRDQEMERVYEAIQEHVRHFTNGHEGPPEPNDIVSPEESL